MAFKLNRRQTKLIVNALLFQLLWFTAVQGNNYYAVAATTAFVVIHALAVVNQWREWVAILTVTSLGYVLDSLLNTFGMFEFYGSGVINSGALQIHFAPLWLLCVWIAFSSTLNHSLNWLNSWPLLASLLGALIAPLSYYAGAALSESSITQPVLLTLFLQALLWSLLMPGFLKLTQILVLADGADMRRRNGVSSSVHSKSLTDTPKRQFRKFKFDSHTQQPAKFSGRSFF